MVDVEKARAGTARVVAKVAKVAAARVETAAVRVAAVEVGEAKRHPKGPV